MVFRILKNIVKTTAILCVGAGIGIWFAPPTTKAAMKQKLAIAQDRTKGMQQGASKLWKTSLEKKFNGAAKNLDPRKIDKKMVSGWIQSGRNAVATISEDAKRTQETIVKANQVLQSAKAEYRKVGSILGM
jgi:hypothetical protein